MNEINSEYPVNPEEAKDAKVDPEKQKAIENKEALLKKAIDGTLFVKAEWDGEGA